MQVLIGQTEVELDAAAVEVAVVAQARQFLQRLDSVLHYLVWVVGLARQRAQHVRQAYAPVGRRVEGVQVVVELAGLDHVHTDV